MASDDNNRNREQQVADLLRTVAERERAPESLQAQISAMRQRAATAPRRTLLPRPAFNFVRLAMPVAAAAVAAIVLTLGGGAGAPSIAQAAALATRAPTAPAPPADPSEPAKLLSAKVGALHFPNWQRAGGWRAVGQRHDALGNRRVTTVYYELGGRRVVYSILSSPTLRLNSELVLQSRPPVYVTAAALTHAGRTTVIWTESGHTCLLTGPRGMSAAELWHLAFFGWRQPVG